MEKFLPACSPPIGLKDQIHALLLVSELVTAAIEYASATSTATSNRLGLCLMCRNGIFTATLSGGDGISLVARELMDESLRGPATADLAHIAHRCGSGSHPDDGELVWVELDLAA